MVVRWWFDGGSMVVRLFTFSFRQSYQSVVLVIFRLYYSDRPCVAEGNTAGAV